VSCSQLFPLLAVSAQLTVRVLVTGLLGPASVVMVDFTIFDPNAGKTVRMPGEPSFLCFSLNTSTRLQLQDSVSSQTSSILKMVACSPCQMWHPSTAVVPLHKEETGWLAIGAAHPETLRVPRAMVFDGGESFSWSTDSFESYTSSGARTLLSACARRSRELPPSTTLACFQSL
jgi:hypothetical protein